MAYLKAENHENACAAIDGWPVTFARLVMAVSVA